MPAGESIAFLLAGAAMLVAYAAHVIGARAHVPRVTVLLLVGLACGPAVLDLVPRDASAYFPLIAEFSLSVFGFLLGEEFVRRAGGRARGVVGVATIVCVVTAALVVGVALLAGAPLPLALVLGGVSTATDPAASLDLIREVRARGPLTDAVVGIVAADDVIAVLVFSLLLAAAEALTGSAAPLGEVGHALWEIGGAVLLGGGVGVPMAWLTGRLRKGEPAIFEALGFVLLVAGLASMLGVSFLLACMVLGATVAKLAKHHTRAVHEIEGFSAPLLAIFFLFAGFQLDAAVLLGVGALGVLYIGARVAGRLVGSRLGAKLVGAPALGLGMCLLPQAGMALGLGLLGAERLPEHAETLMSLVIASTVFFELVGPLLARLALRRAGEIAAVR